MAKFAKYGEALAIFLSDAWKNYVICYKSSTYMENK